ncbi:MAG: hypothetical protein BWY15_01324 [Firmicutes bacterium ADurb.Bin193]|nr:MAG: hypothetical protein BWY15_01324 [Firmicutes bacterium ADurb.Bin193]
MKKTLKLILCAILITGTVELMPAFTAYVNENGVSALQDKIARLPYITENDTVFVPLKEAFEVLGAVVFHNSDTNEIFAITRDSDVITHKTGEGYILKNDETIELKQKSFIRNDKTYLPIETVSHLFYADVSLNRQGEAFLQKQFTYNEYHEQIFEVLKYSSKPYFNPLNFRRYLAYKSIYPKISGEEAILYVNMNLDYPFYAAVKEIENPHELLVLCNKYNKLPDDFSPYNIVSFDEGYYSGNGRYINSVAKQAFQQMADDGKKAGAFLVSVSSLRTKEYQA